MSDLTAPNYVRVILQERRLEQLEAELAEYRTGQLVPLPEVEELVRVVDHTAYQKGWKGKSLDKQMVENLIIAILNHMKGKVDGA